MGVHLFAVFFFLPLDTAYTPGLQKSPRKAGVLIGVLFYTGFLVLVAEI